MAKTSKELSRTRQAGGEMLRLMSTVAAIPALAGFTQYLTSNRQNKAQLKSLADSFETIKEDNPDIAKNPNAGERFFELSALAPTIGQNPKMAARFLKPRLDKGLSIDDVHKLTMIQSHARTSPYRYDPADAAGARASTVLDRILMVFGPQISHKALQTQSMFAKDMKDLNKQGAAVKSTKLSDECVGEMLGDRYCMLKEAASAKGYANIAKKGLSRFGEGTAFFSAGLALAGLGHLAGKAVDHVRQKQMEGEAEKAFIEARKHSTTIKERQAEAREAFDILKSFAPSLATKPSIVKTFLETSVNRTVPGTPLVDMPELQVKNLVDTHNVASRPNYQSFSHGFSGAMSPGLNFFGQMADQGQYVTEQDGRGGKKTNG